MAVESKISFFDSLVKIGHGFQEIFGIFGNAIRDALGLTAVKSGDKRSKVGEHFDKIKKGLGDTKDKLDGLAKDITSTPHADTTGVEATIKGASDVIVKLVDSVTKLASVTNDDADIGDNAAGAAVAADKDSVETVIKEVKAIIETAKESGVKIDKGNDGGTGAAAADATATAALGGNNGAGAGAGAGSKLADEITKADPWAMIDKVKNAKITSAVLTADANNDAGALATGGNANGNNGAKAATNADLAAAIALKAMIKDGRFSANAADKDIVKAAAASAVNKVLGVLDFIIRKTVANNLDKIREAVKGIQYSETTTEIPEASTTQPTATK
ncbi:variable large family protein (plasmid) [Borrelia turicatae 91E135]|uniref:Variable large protein n=1 Tax=Borrelia turicatae (strain 91E135) TaxID=314724 RepID=A0ABF7R043_BORT9|nr:VlpB-type protein [Borrelia turicatae 91E135]UPA14262.1 variable large family protein [Borrelia turicatae 91E135]